MKERWLRTCLNAVRHIILDVKTVLAVRPLRPTSVFEPYDSATDVVRLLSTV